MVLKNKEAELFIPDNTNEEIALARTTSLCFAAHQDDIEIMAYSPISQCFNSNEKWFTGVVVTDGAGSPRAGVYEQFTDEEMKRIRVKEQKTAALIGNYSAQFLLAYKSCEVKSKSSREIIDEIKDIILRCNPEVIYTHNLADKHDTHVAVVLRVIQAIRELPLGMRHAKVYSMEVWRGLDWLNDEDKTSFDTSSHPNMAAALLGVFDSQIAGGKRYDAAAIGRRSANATFFASHSIDSSDSLNFGLDITSLINNNVLSPERFIEGYINNFKNEVLNRLEKLDR